MKWTVYSMSLEETIAEVIELKLCLWIHMDYFYNVFIHFSKPQSFGFRTFNDGTEMYQFCYLAIVW